MRERCLINASKDGFDVVGSPRFIASKAREEFLDPFSDLVSGSVDRHSCTIGLEDSVRWLGRVLGGR